MPGPSDPGRPPPAGAPLDDLRERLLGVEERASVKSWFPRLRQTVARLAESEASLRRLNEKLEGEVAARTEELSRANAELARKNETLERALAELRASREALLRSERLAATASLAGSIAHELNSPLGALISSTASLYELSRGEAERLAAGLPDFASEEGRTFCDLVAAGSAAILDSCERGPSLEDRLHVEDELARRGLPLEPATIDALLTLGVGSGSPLLDPALAWPRALKGAMVVAEALSAATVARRSGEKAAEVVRRLQRSVAEGFDGLSPVLYNGDG